MSEKRTVNETQMPKGVRPTATHENLRAQGSGHFIHLVEKLPEHNGVAVRNQTLAGHVDTVYSIAFSPDGATLASGSGDKSVNLWDVASGQMKRTFVGHTRSVWSVAFSPDGATLASGSPDKTVILWDPLSGQKQQTLAGHTDCVYSVAFSSDGATLASGSGDNTVILWDPVSGQKKQTLAGHSSAVWSVAFSPDGATLASGSEDKTAILWDVASGRKKQTFVGHAGGARSIAFSPNGLTLASGSADHTVILWDIISGQKKQTLLAHHSFVYSVSFSQDGATVVSGSSDKTVILWDAASGQKKQTLSGHTRGLWSVGFSPDGATLASGGDDNKVILWDAALGQKKHTFAGHIGHVNSVAFSPDGATLASGSEDRTVILWDVASGRKKQTLADHTQCIYSVAFTPDGATLASGSGDNTVILWDAASGQKRQTLAGHSDAVVSVAFSPDGEAIASGSNDKTVILWDVASGQKLGLHGPFEAGVASVSFDLQDESVVVHDHDGKVHRIPSSALLRLKVQLMKAELKHLDQRMLEQDRALAERDNRLLHLSNQLSSLTMPTTTRKLLVEAFEVPLPSTSAQSPLTELAWQVVEEYCVRRLTMRLVASAQRRIQEMEMEINLMHQTSPEISILTEGLECERRWNELAATMRSLSEQLALCQVDYSLEPSELETKLQIRDVAREAAVKLWRLLEVQRDELAAHLKSGAVHRIRIGLTQQDEDDPDPCGICATVEQEALSNLRECTGRVVELVGKFVDSVADHLAFPSPNDLIPSSIRYQEEYSATIQLRDALQQSQRSQIESKVALQTAKLKRELATQLTNAEQTLSQIDRTMKDLEQDVLIIIDITATFPSSGIAGESIAPRNVARNRLMAVKKNYVNPLALHRHKKNKIYMDMEFYKDQDLDTWTDLAKEMDALDATLTKLAETFVNTYENEVTFTRLAFPELEEYVHTQIDPFCGQGNFRMDLGPADFTMTKLYEDTVFKASPVSVGVAEAKKLDAVYAIKKFSVLNVFLQELAAMRHAKTDGKQHHENVAEPCFTFSHKDIGGVVYYYIGLPYYRSSSPEWFIARISAGEKGAMVQAMLGMVRGLECLHRNQIVHGDVKPANVLFDSETVTGVPKWIDFNFSSNRSATLKLRGLKTVVSVGFSEGFSAPEQREHSILSPQADVYALGKTFAALLFVAGCSPWEKDERKGEGTWLEGEVKKLFGVEIHSQLVDMIQCMTKQNEPERISLVTDYPLIGPSVLNRLEGIRRLL